jgi:hypothetical protein
LISVDPNQAGKDATEAFFSLHRYEVLERPQFKRLVIGSITGQQQQIFPRASGELSKVPYAEATWLTSGYFSPYYKDVGIPVFFELSHILNHFFSTIGSSRLLSASLLRMLSFPTVELARRMARGLPRVYSMKWRS